MKKKVFRLTFAIMVLLQTSSWLCLAADKEDSCQDILIKGMRKYDVKNLSSYEGKFHDLLKMDYETVRKYISSQNNDTEFTAIGEAFLLSLGDSEDVRREEYNKIRNSYFSSSNKEIHSKILQEISARFLPKEFGDRWLECIKINNNNNSDKPVFLTNLSHPSTNNPTIMVAVRYVGHENDPATVTANLISTNLNPKEQINLVIKKNSTILQSFSRIDPNSMASLAVASKEAINASYDKIDFEPEKKKTQTTSLENYLSSGEKVFVTFDWLPWSIGSIDRSKWMYVFYSANENAWRSYQEGYRDNGLVKDLINDLSELPRNRRITIWGHGFRFDEQGYIYDTDNSTNHGEPKRPIGKIFWNPNPVPSEKSD